MNSVAEVVVAYLLIVLIAASVLVLVGAFVRLVRNRMLAWRTRRCLGTDWWSTFERELHDYVSQTWSSAREAERHE